MNSALFEKYKEFCSHFAFKQILKKATRITFNSPNSLLDHILTNSVQNISQYGIIDLAISDHQMIYLTRKINHLNFKTHKEIHFLCLKKCDSCEFCAPPRMERELFQSLRFIPVPEMDDSGEHYKAFEVSFI